MSTDLVAVVVALTLGTAVVIVGLRRNLSETTRNGLPRFGREEPEQATVLLGLYEGGHGRWRPESPRERRRWALLGLLLSLWNATFAVLGASGRLFYVVMAVILALNAGWNLKGSSRSPGGSAS